MKTATGKITKDQAFIWQDLIDIEHHSLLHSKSYNIKVGSTEFGDLYLVYDEKDKRAHFELILNWGTHLLSEEGDDAILGEHKFSHSGETFVVTIEEME
jgi:hypothetical protein